MRNNPTRRRPWVAAKALKRLIADAERTEEVFVVLRALSGDVIERRFARFAARPERLTWLERSLIDTLDHREALRALPPGSLGRAYLEFVEREQLSAGGLVEASNGSELARADERVGRFAERLRDMHDLWHVVSGYGRDPFGEVCLLAFTYAQTRNPGIAVIAAIGTLKLARHRGRGIAGAVWQAYRHGRRAAWLPAEHWESLLAEPLDDVRARLTILAPSRYRSLSGAGTSAAAPV